MPPLRSTSRRCAAPPLRSCAPLAGVTRFARGVHAGFHTRKSIKRNHFRRSMFEVEAYCRVRGTWVRCMVQQ